MNHLFLKKTWYRRPVDWLCCVVMEMRFFDSNLGWATLGWATLMVLKLSRHFKEIILIIKKWLLRKLTFCMNLWKFSKGNTMGHKTKCMVHQYLVEQCRLNPNIKSLFIRLIKLLLFPWTWAVTPPNTLFQKL